MSIAIVLPPSETKAIPSPENPPLDLDSLGFPSFTPVRTELLEKVEHACQTVPEDRLLTFMGLSERLRAEIEFNKTVSTNPTLPAVELYTGVLYDALDTRGDRTGVPLTPQQADRLWIASALFGLTRGTDRIPHYRVSADTVFSAEDRAGWLRKMWKKHMLPAVDHWRQTEKETTGVDPFILDLRSGAYQKLGSVGPSATVKVVLLIPDGRERVVTHWSKHYKGQLARALVQAADHHTEAKDPFNALTGVDAVAEVITDTLGYTARIQQTDTGFTIVMGIPYDNA